MVRASSSGFPYAGLSVDGVHGLHHDLVFLSLVFLSLLSLLFLCGNWYDLDVLVLAVSLDHVRRAECGCACDGSRVCREICCEIEICLFPSLYSFSSCAWYWSDDGGAYAGPE